MPLNEATIEPQNALPQAAPATPAPTTPAEPAGDGKGLFKKLGRDPVIRMILGGEVPGTIVPKGTRYKKAEEIAQHADFIQNDMGLLFWGAKDGSVALYNPAVVTQDELAAADAEGKIYELLPEYGKLTGEKPAKEPTPAAPGQRGAAALVTPTLPAVPPANPAGIPMQNAGSRTATMKNRIRNLIPEPPTGGSAALAAAQQRAV